MMLSNLIPISSPVAQNVDALAERLEAVEAVDGAAQHQIAVEFESVFISLLLKEMRQTLNEDGFFAGDQSDVYGGIFDLFMGQHLAQSGGLGISQMIDVYLESANVQ